MHNIMNIVMDIGGSRMRFAAVIKKELGKAHIVKTPETYEEAMVLIGDVVAQIVADSKAEDTDVHFCVCGIAGVLAEDGSRLLVSPNLDSWVGKPLQQDLARMTGARIILKNDTDMTGLGEALHGAGKGHDIVAYLTFSTGIGGSLIVNGDVGAYSLGYEPGFQLVEQKKFLHDVSGAELQKNYGALFKDITDGAVRNHVMRYVIAGIHNTIVYWSPQIIVLGGGMTESFDLAQITTSLEKMRCKLPTIPTIVLAEHTDINGLYGGMAYLQNHFTK
jgi:glucokinase